ncbi:MAG: hypothetical protein IT448_04975 [Phycisphaerales bacterium]|nr:hypothetical protein [Phycisphaerales bacterium]
MPDKYPIGQLCVIRHPRQQDYMVCICHGPAGKRELLGRFPDLAAASEFALLERDKRSGQGDIRVIQFPDDCPCSGEVQINVRTD